MAGSFNHVDWHLQVRANSQMMVEKVLRDMEKATGLKYRKLSSEPAGKTDNLFDVKAVSNLGGEDAAQVIFRLLLIMREIATGWQIKGPISYGDGQWLFGALAGQPQARFLILGIEWANLETRNFPMVKK